MAAKVSKRGARDRHLYDVRKKSRLFGQRSLNQALVCLLKGGMEYIKFGNTGMMVSRICLGCMTYGKPTERWPWALDETQSRPFIQKAFEMGINFSDTADVYTGGESEKVTGKILWQLAPRDQIVLATKVFNPMGPGPND